MQRATEATADLGAMTPRPFRVTRRRRETSDTWTLELEPVSGEPIRPEPGQFTMLYAFGIGEVPISVSGEGDGPLVHTVRAVGAVTEAVCASRPGAVLGVRGPYGNAWPVAAAAGADVVIVAGGIGLAPLRPALYHVLRNRGDYGKIALLYGSRTPDLLLYKAELERLRGRFDVHVGVTVDSAEAGWRGRVGVVPKLVGSADFDPASTLALVCGPEIMMRFAAEALLERGLPPAQLHLSMERNMRCGLGHCGHCQLGPTLISRDGPVYRYDELETLMAVRELWRKPKLAVWKFASCDGCQLSLLDCEDELLRLAGEVEIAYFLEARRATVKGPYDLSLVEGSVTTAHDAERIRQVRSRSRRLVTIGACATAGGIQALRNFADVNDYLSVVYASPEYVSTLETSTPISAHVPVDFELHGCPIDKRQLLEVITAFLHGRRPNIASTSVCTECKRRGTVCVMVANGTPCLGPVTHAGCGALCPAYDRGCYGCFGPMETPNTVSLTRQLKVLDMSDRSIDRVFRTFNVAAFEEARDGG